MSAKTAGKKKTRGSTPVVVMEDAGRSFGERVVLSGLNIKISAGEMAGIVGPNGGGKTTLLLLMSGLLRATTGRVLVCTWRSCPGPRCSTTGSAAPCPSSCWRR